MKTIIWLAGVTAVALAMSIGVAGPGARLGLWSYADGLTLIRQVSAPVELLPGLIPLSPIFTVAGAAAFLGFGGIFIGARWIGTFALFAAALAAASGMAPLQMRKNFEKYPYIHEVTTDFENPPMIVAAADATRNNPAEYRGADDNPRGEYSNADAQRLAFPQIETVYFAGSMSDAVAKTKSAIKTADMKIIAETVLDDGVRIEATYTSFWFGFVDDFVVRLRDEGGRVRIDVRSKSRVGGSDLGANGLRVIAFIERMQTP